VALYGVREILECPHCGLRRELYPSLARQRKTQECQACSRLRTWPAKQARWAHDQSASAQKKFLDQIGRARTRQELQRIRHVSRQRVHQLLKRHALLDVFPRWVRQEERA